MTYAPNRRAPGLLLSWFLIDGSMGACLWLNGPSNLSRIVLAGGIGVLLFALLRRPDASMQPSLTLIEMGIALVLALELAQHVAIPFRPELPVSTVPVAVLAAVALGAVIVWLVSRRSPSAALVTAGALAVVLVTALAARFAIVAWDMEPGFDVHLIQEAAGRAILAGQNPYLTHIYDSGYPYWPLSALLAAGGLLVGDARWGLLVADAVTAAAFVVIARNVGAPGRFGALAAALLLWNSSGLYMTWQSLPEPAVIAFGAVGVALLTRPRPRGVLAGVALGLAIATKQLGLGLLAFLPLSRDPRRWTATAVATAVAGLIVAAFFVLAPAAFLEGSVSSHLMEPSRNYAINLLDPLPGIVPRLNVPIVITGILALGIGLVVRLRWPDAIDGWLAATVALLMVAFALIGISFLNYYQIPLALLLILVMIPDGWTLEARSPRTA